MTKLQRAFAPAYIACGGNIVQAARQAGSKAKTVEALGVVGRRLFRNVLVAAEIARLSAPIIQEAELNAQRTLHELAIVALADVEITAAAKVKALELWLRIHRLIDAPETGDTYNDNRVQVAIGALTDEQLAAVMAIRDAIAPE